MEHLNRAVPTMKTTTTLSPPPTTAPTPPPTTTPSPPPTTTPAPPPTTTPAPPPTTTPSPPPTTTPSPPPPTTSAPPSTTTSLPPSTAPITLQPVAVPSKKIDGFSAGYFKRVQHVKNVTQGKEILKESINKITPRNTSESPVGENAIEMTQGLETVALILAQNILKPNQSISVKTKQTFVKMSIPTSAFIFPSLEEKAAQNITETLAFPDSIVELGVTVVCMAYSNLHDFLPKTTKITSANGKSNTSFSLNSKIIGAAVNPPLTSTLKDPIAITFDHKPVPVGRQICSFWNHSIRNQNGKFGQWSTNGCELNVNKSSPTRTVCECNHLTSFALLLQSEDEPPTDPPLSLKIITYVGCGLSFLGCFLCFVMFWSSKKKDVRHYLHINLSVALAISQTILIFGIHETRNKIVCKVMAVSLHYFYLVAFLFMLSEGVHLVVLVETSFKYGSLKLPVYISTSWGIPLLIVGITLAVRFDNYGSEVVCFISAEKGAVYAFLGPFCLILAINTILLIIVLRHVLRKTSLPVSSKAASKFELVRATVRSLVILFPVMGFTWVFGILYFGLRSIILEYLFGIFCSLQGFFVFLFQYALNTENRSAFLRAVSRWRTSTTSSNLSRPDSQAARGNNSRNQESIAMRSRLDDAVPRQADKCHLLVYRTLDEDNKHTNGTLSTEAWT